MGNAIYRKEKIQSGYQQWTGYPQSLDLSENYPFQAILQNQNGTTKYLFVAYSRLEFGGTGANQVIHITDNSSGKVYKYNNGFWEYWLSFTSFNLFFGTPPILQANNDVWEEGLSSVYFAKTTTAEQDAGYVENNIRVRNLRHKTSILSQNEGITYACGYAHTMVIKQDGTLWALGQNSDGQLGLGDTANRINFTQVGASNDWKSVACGYFHTMAVKTDGTLWVAGLNSSGQLGLGDNVRRLLFTQVGTLDTWKSVACGDSHTMAINNDGTLWATGYNGQGGLGLDDTANRINFTQVGTSNDWKSVACGGGHTVAIKTDGTMWATGHNVLGQLGISSLATSLRIFTKINTQGIWESVSSFASHTVATKTDGTLWATGYNYHGQLGLDDTANRFSFTQVGTSNDWKSSSCGYSHTMAVKTDGTLWVAGQNSYGALGLEIITQRTALTQVGTSNDWKSVACSSNHTIAIKQDNALWITGYNADGRLGLGDTINRNILTTTATIVKPSGDETSVSSEVRARGVWWKSNILSGFQQWTNYPQSPVLTEDYPYQCISYDGSIQLVMSVFQMNYNDTFDPDRLNINNYRIYPLQSGNWNPLFYYSGTGANYNNTNYIIEANNDIIDTNTSAVYFPKTTTAEQDGTYISTLNRINT